MSSTSTSPPRPGLASPASRRSAWSSASSTAWATSRPSSSPTPDGEEGPPLAILVIGSILGVVALVAAILAWRGNRLGAAGRARAR